MPNREQIKEQIATDFRKAKSAGGTRIERIRQIMQEAFAQAATELKAGTNEIGSIAKDSTSGLIDNLKEKPQAAPQPSPVEVKIEDGDQHIPTEIVDVVDETVEIQPITTPAPMAPKPIQLLPAESVEEPAEAETEPPAAQSFADVVTAWMEQVMQSFKQGEVYGSLQQQLTKLKEQWPTLDAKLAERYGERYETFKQEFYSDMTKGKTWYDRAKAEATTTGTTWVEQKQANLEIKLDQAGATIAQKEQKIKQLLKELWQTVSSK
jgi:hypothetical protein